MSKLQVTLKDPDTLYDAVEELLDEELKDLPADEAEAIREVRGEKYRAIAAKWFTYGEYLTVDIDLDKATIEVRRAAES